MKKFYSTGLENTNGPLGSGIVMKTSLLSVILLLLSMHVTPALAQANLLISPQTVNVVAGDTFSVKVRVSSDNQPVTGATINLQFDPAILEAQNITSSGTFDALLRKEIDNNAGVIEYSEGKLIGTPPTGSFDLFTAEFLAKAQGSSNLDFITYHNTNTELAYQGFDITNDLLAGQVIVAAENQPPTAEDINIETNEEEAVSIILNGNDANEDSLSYKIASGPGHGSLSDVNDNEVIYTPEAGFAGSDAFTYQASDEEEDSNIATVTVTVNKVNHKPVAENQNVNVDEDTPKEIQLKGSDSDGDALTYVVINDPQLGSLNSFDAGSGKIIYLPKTNFSGNDSFSFKVSDGIQDSDPATVSLTVTKINEDQPPTAENIEKETNEDQAVKIKLKASNKKKDGDGGEDGDGDEDDEEENAKKDLTYNIVSPSQHGSLSDVNGDEVTYTPDADFAGQDSFTYQASDGEETSNIATATVTVNAINDAPSFELTADPPAIEESAGQQSIPNFATNIDDGDPELPQGLSFQVSKISGELTFAQEPAINESGILTYQAADNASGTATFEVTLTDDGLAKGGDHQNTSEAETFTITVNKAVVVAPAFTLDPEEVIRDEDFAGTTTVTVTPEPGTPQATYSLSPASVSFANVSVNTGSGTVSISAKDNQSGSATFTLTADAGNGNTASRSFSLTVNAVNDAPEITGQSTELTTKEKQPLPIRLSALSVEDPDNTYPDGFTLTVLAGENYTVDETTITPVPGFSGTLKVAVQVNDGTTSSNTFELTVTVTDVNTPPVPVPTDTITAKEDDLLVEIKLHDLFKDTEDAPDALTYDVISSINSNLFPTWEITPDDLLVLTLAAGRSGSSSIKVEATDTEGLSAENTVIVTVEKVNDLPTATDIPDQTLAEDGESLSLDLSSYFSDEEDNVNELLFAIADNSHPDLLNAKIISNMLNLIPVENANGSIILAIMAKDTEGAGVQATFKVTVTPVNDKPVLNNIEAEPVVFNERDRAQPITKTIQVTDIDNPKFQQAVVRFVKEENIVFLSGEDILQYNTPANINANWNPDSGVLTFTGTSSLANYQTALRSVKYNNTKPNNPTSGLRKISISVNDGEYNSEEAVRFIAVSNPDLPPLIIPYSVEIQEDQSHAFQRPDFESHYNDPDGNPFTGIYIQSLPKHGTLFLDNQSIDGENIVNAPRVNGQFAGFPVAATDINKLTYTPDLNYVGDDSFKWNAFDGNSFAANATRVFVTITPLNDAPGIQAPFSVSAQEATLFVFSDFTINDPDAGNDKIRLRLSVAHGLLSFTNQGALAILSFIEGDGTGDNVMEFEASQNNINNALKSLGYTSQTNFEGADTLFIKVSDLGASGPGGEQKAEDQTLISVGSVNDIPALENMEADPLSYAEGAGAVAVTETVTIKDAENNNIIAATIIISGNFTPAEDILSFSNTDKIKGNFSENRLILTGTASVAEYEAALRSITYENTSEDPVTLPRLIKFQVTDVNNGFSQIVMRTINIISIDDALMLTNLETSPLVYALEGAPQRLSNSIAIENPDSSIITGAMVSFTSKSYIPGEDSVFIDSDLIPDAHWDENTGSLVLRGNNTKENYELALRNLFYINRNGNGATMTDRSISFQVFTDDDESNILTRAIRIITNEKPTVSDFEKSVLKDNRLLFSPADFESSFSDTDGMPYDGSLFSIRIMTLPEHGILTLGNDTLTQEMIDALPGYVIETDRMADLAYIPQQSYTGSDAFEWNGSDGAEYASESAKVNIEIINLIVDAGEDQEICEGEQTNLEVNISGGSDDYTFSWTCNRMNCALDNNSSASVFVSPSTTTTYVVEVTDLNGNISITDTVVVQTSPCFDLTLNIPSGITPNGDHINDTWIINNIDTYSNTRLEIFNRYGKKVFQSEGYNQPWDGTFEGNELPVGTYYYVINLNNGEKVHKGAVTILR